MKARLIRGYFKNDYGIEVVKKPNFGVSELHGHDFYEIDIILGGKSYGKLNREEIDIARGDIFFLTPEDFHEYGIDGCVDILNLQFSEDSISATVLGQMVNSGRRHFRLTEDRFMEFERLSDLLLDLYTEKVDIEIISRLLESLLLLLPRDEGERCKLGSEKSSDIQKAIVYVGAHFRENPSLSEVASVIHLNERYFCLKFKEYTGESYKEYLKNLKLRYARRLILASNYSMLEVAERSGYMTQSHFNREFKAKFGVTPTILRKEK